MIPTTRPAKRIATKPKHPLTPERKKQMRDHRIAKYKAEREACGKVYIPKAERIATKAARPPKPPRAPKPPKPKATTKHKMAPIQRVGKPREKVLPTRVNGDAGKVKTWSSVLRAHVMVGEGKTLAQIEEKYLGRRENQIGKW